jgi:hypothetical protein
VQAWSSASQIRFREWFQSWTTSREYFAHEKIKGLSWFLKPFGKHSGDSEIFPPNGQELKSTDQNGLSYITLGDL